MRGRLLLLLKRMWRRPGVRITLFGGAALLAALLAPFVDRTVPEAWQNRFSRDAVLPILNILASSMLAVSTFSLGVMVQAFRAAASQTTPRVYRIIMQDMTTQNVLSVFVGSFLFSLTSIVMFRAGFYGESAAVIVFGMTVACIVLIIVAILRWIAHLSRLGSLDHTLELVERATIAPLKQLADKPNFGARAADDAPKAPDGSKSICATTSGFVQYINFSGLQDALAESDATLWVLAPPGRWVLKNTPLAQVTGDVSEDAVLEHFTIGVSRTLEQDARFGMIIMSEVASRALSPGVNDPGSAIDIIHRAQRVLWELGLKYAANENDQDGEDEIQCNRIIIGHVTASDLMNDAFSALMLDGGDRVDVMAHVLKATKKLSRSDWPDLAKAAQKTQQDALRIIERRFEDPELVKKLRRKADAA